MFNGAVAEYFGVKNVPVADRKNFFDIGYDITLTSILMVDRIEDLDAFAIKVRNHFMQWERCRSDLISVGNHQFFEKVGAENMVEILEEMTEEEGLALMEREQSTPFKEGEAHHKVYLIPSGDKLMILSKTDHTICDGLSIFHMWQ